MARVLVVDDDPIVRSMACEMLLAAGHQASEAAEGEAALKIIAREPIDLVVLDMLMPGKDGLETIMELRVRRPSVRILAISSGGRSGPGAYLQAALTFGAHKALTKPLRADALLAAVDELLAPEPARPTVVH